MSATEELRALLDGRGVEYKRGTGPANVDTVTIWKGRHGRWCFAFEDQLEGGLRVQSIVTPAQAVEATLGSGECEKVYAVGGIIAQAECRNVSSDIEEFTCSACKFNCNLTSWVSLFDGDEGRHGNRHHGTPNYCPNCGRAVKR